MVARRLGFYACMTTLATFGVFFFLKGQVMLVKLQVQGVETARAAKTGNPYTFAFGFEAAPATLRQPINLGLPEGRQAPKAGEVVSIEVEKLTTSKDGTVWLRGKFNGNGK